MSRMELYKTKRHRRQRCFAAIMLFALLLTVGILTVDRVTNTLVEGQRGFSIAAFEGHEDYLEITFMNRTFCINTEYLNRDIDKLRQFIWTIE